MTAVYFTDEQYDVADWVVARIGQAIREAREARGESQYEVADALQMRQTTVSDAELGKHVNLKVGTAIKLLDRYGLTLVVQAKAKTP